MNYNHLSMFLITLESTTTIQHYHQQTYNPNQEITVDCACMFQYLVVFCHPGIPVGAPYQVLSQSKGRDDTPLLLLRYPGKSSFSASAANVPFAHERSLSWSRTVCSAPRGDGNDVDNVNPGTCPPLLLADEETREKSFYC